MNADSQEISGGKDTLARHVHMVVKAESEHGRRLHINKEMLRQWREDFVRMMREQGIAANATSRVLRGRTKGKMRDAIYRSHQRGASDAIRHRVNDVVTELRANGTIRDPARAQRSNACLFSSA